MIIRKVSIENFFCFLGPNEFEFTEGLNIISGRNGGGKSQFFNAFYWTFFDKIYTDENSKDGKKRWQDGKNVTIYPDHLNQTVRIGDDIKTKVEITLDAIDYKGSTYQGYDNITYTFRKSVTFQRKEQGLVSIIPAELRIEYLQNGETFFVSSGEQDILLDKIFPKSIRKFMWYQGETMEDLYDFSNNATLRNAINEISYFPKYDFMEKVVKQSEKSINNKVQKELTKQNKLTKEENSVYADITYLEKTIETLETDQKKLTAEIHDLEELITKTELKLEGLDKFLDFKVKLAQLEADKSLTRSRIDDIDVNTKERLINKWMLNGCEKLIKASIKNLEAINDEIQKSQNTKNPVPTSLPGPEYVEKMIADHICYICERPVDGGSAAYEALRRRLNDFEVNAQLKVLQDNYTDLNRARKRLQGELPSINDEISENNKTKETLIKKRISIDKQIANIFDELGSDQKNDLEAGANIAQENTNKLKTYRGEIGLKTRRLAAVNHDLTDKKLKLNEKKNQRDKFIKKADSTIVESAAAEYVTLFVKGIGRLKDQAYKNLIDELETESNKLYSLYLAGKQQGRITINGAVQIVDEDTREQLIDLNTGEMVAQKLAVANSFLSLSEKKMGRSYPLIADAPSSDLDSKNTYNLTVNIGKSFNQIIIMSKDYSDFDGVQLSRLIEEAKIKNFYKLENVKIDEAGSNSRTNKKTITKKVR